MDWHDIEARVREDEVNSLEAFTKGKADAPVLYRPTTFEKAVDDEGHMVFIASTEDIDRGGDVIRQDGWQLENFQKNPVYQWAHDYSRPPIGTVPKVWLQGKTLMNTVRFDEGDSFATEIRGKFERGVLRAQSVGFKPLEYSERESETKSFAGYEFHKSELLEISAVPIPMNQAALRKAVELSEKAPTFFFLDGSTWDSKDVTPAEPEPEPTTDPITKDANDEPDVEVKAGRVLSRKNHDALTRASELIASVLDTQGVDESDDGDGKAAIAEIKNEPSINTEPDGEEIDLLGDVMKALKSVRQEDN